MGIGTEVEPGMVRKGILLLGAIEIDRKKQGWLEFLESTKKKKKTRMHDGFEIVKKKKTSKSPTYTSPEKGIEESFLEGIRNRKNISLLQNFYGWDLW